MRTIWERKWKVAECGASLGGSFDCWCRIIVAANAKPKKSDGEYYNKDIFITAGCISKDQAEYFVKLHYNTLKG